MMSLKATSPDSLANGKSRNCYVYMGVIYVHPRFVNVRSNHVCLYTGHNHPYIVRPNILRRNAMNTSGRKSPVFGIPLIRPTICAWARRSYSRYRSGRSRASYTAYNIMRITVKVPDLITNPYLDFGFRLWILPSVICLQQGSLL